MFMDFLQYLKYYVIPEPHRYFYSKGSYGMPDPRPQFHEEDESGHTTTTYITKVLLVELTFPLLFMAMIV